MLAYLLLFPLCVAQSQNNPIVTTPLGSIRGYHRTSFGQRTFLAFEGIPYAQPPVGNKRFQEPQPVQPWKGTFQAHFLYQCPQLQQTTLIGDEDCLYLNVYTALNISEKLDVVVHIHGGGFMAGSSHEYVSPDYLMDHDLVFVSFNYRLGVFGFLSTEDDVVPGNNGLKDQVLALKWVQQNIASFGGNPNSVTLTGVSAGGASVHLHYLSPLSEGLFHKGLSRSGCALNPWVFQGEARNKAGVLGSLVGCHQNTSRELLECLKTRHYRDIMSHVQSFYRYKVLPISPFGPVVEHGTNPFLDRDPYSLLVKKEVRSVPWMVSFVEDDGGALLTHVEGVDTRWESLAPLLLNYNYTVPKSLWGSVLTKVKNFYADKGLVKLTTDRITVAGVGKAVSLQAEATNAPVYLYKFKYTGAQNSVVHYDDNQYFYRDPSKNPDVGMTHFMIDMLLSFVRTGKPKVGSIDWKSVKPHEINCLNIAGFNEKNVTLERVTNLGNGDFWDSLGENK